MTDNRVGAPVRELREDPLPRRRRKDGIVVADVDEIRVAELQLVHDDVAEHDQLASL